MAIWIIRGATDFMSGFWSDTWPFSLPSPKQWAAREPMTRSLGVTYRGKCCTSHSTMTLWSAWWHVFPIPTPGLFLFCFSSCLSAAAPVGDRWTRVNCRSALTRWIHCRLCPTPGLVLSCVRLSRHSYSFNFLLSTLQSTVYTLQFSRGPSR